MSRRARVALVLVAVTLALMFGAVWLQRAILYPRAGLRQDPTALRTPGLERWWLDTDGGQVEAWMLPGDGVSVERGPAVIFAHGNGELIDYWADALAPYRRWGVSVVLFEYRGYGRSEGRPSEEAITADLRALYTRVADDPRVDPNRIVLHGRSLGGGAVCTLVPAHPPRALVLESTFTSVPDLARESMHVPRVVMVERYESLDAVSHYAGPVLVFHGERDQVVPFSHGRRLVAAAANATLVTRDAGHNDLLHDRDFWSRVRAFLHENGVLEGGREE